eukprot:331929-Chlamydomonas_euryale.AAC.2
MRPSSARHIVHTFVAPAPAGCGRAQHQGVWDDASARWGHPVHRARRICVPGDDCPPAVVRSGGVDAAGCGWRGRRGVIFVGVWVMHVGECGRGVWNRRRGI